MRGINYGHHWTASAGRPNTYDSNIASREMAWLLIAGYKVIRIVYPTFDGSSGSMSICRDMVERALELPFSRVIWGVVGHRSPVTENTFAAHAEYIRSVVAPYAQGLRDSRLQLSVGNEEELGVDNVTITVASLQPGIRQLMADTSDIYTKGIVDYVTAATYSPHWGILGVPPGTRIGLNLYYEWSPFRTFLISASAMRGRHGNKFYIAEWSTSKGFLDAEKFGTATAEQNWSDNLQSRRDLLDKLFEGYDIDDCIFAYRDGAFGVLENHWGLVKTDGTPRLAWHTQTQQRKIEQRNYSSRQYSFRK